MKIYGKNRKGKPECSTQPRKRTKPTKAEKRLKRRQESHRVFMAQSSDPGVHGRKITGGYRCPGSLQLS